MKRSRRRGPSNASTVSPSIHAGADPETAAVLRPAPLDDLPRHAAMIVLCRQAKLWPDVDLSVLPRTLDLLGDRLSPLDRAFVHALYDATVRRWNTLEYFIQCELHQPIGGIEARLRAVLLAAAAQVLFMDKVPSHAAINHAVEWAKRVIRPGAGAVANAVLRKIAPRLPEDRAAARRERFTGAPDELALDDGGAVAILGAPLPDDPVRRLAVAASCPEPLLDHWLKSRPMHEVRHLALHGLSRAPVTLNTAHATAPLPEGLTPHTAPGHHVYVGPPADLPALLAGRSDIWVQDAASSVAVSSLRGLSPRVIADLCAGQGTKTRQLAAMFPSAEIIATDIDRDRLHVLSRVLAHTPNVRTLPFPAVRDRLLGAADLVLLDVPCSNTGVLSRRPEARHRFDAKHLDALTALQRQIIADTIPLLNTNPRGGILFSTCSIEPEENQQHAAWAAKWHTLSPTREHAALPAGGPGSPPDRHADGAYSVLLAG